MKPIKEGKVREIYDNGDSLILVATDRISCFDVILNNTVTNKGKVLLFYFRRYKGNRKRTDSADERPFGRAAR